VCHREKGIPVEKNTPIIWGQAGGYMYIQMDRYQRGTRPHQQMSEIVRDMDRLEMVALAEYFAQKFWPRLRQPIPPEEIARLRAMRTGRTGHGLPARPMITF
jgi:cytochrome c553